MKKNSPKRGPASLPESSHSTFAIVVSEFNSPFPKRLLKEALRGFLENGVEEKNIAIAYVPGAFEIPLVAKKFAESGKYQAVLCLGAVIRGETPHFDLVANQMAYGLVEVSLTTGIPIIFSVLTTENERQAEERIEKGYEGALTALRMANLLRELCV